MRYPRGYRGWPASQCREGLLPFRDAAVRKAGEDALDRAYAAGAPRDLDGFLRWSREQKEI